jgi:Flp pilus assembly protein TadG
MRQGLTKLILIGQRRLAKNSLRPLLCNKNGATAVEFALVAVPFFALLYAIFETALVFFSQQVLQTATTQASRLIMTGQAQAQNMTAAQFQQQVCTNASSMFNCAKMYVNIQTFSSFSSVSQLNPVQNGSFSSSSLSYSLGTPGDIELVQVFYEWPVFTGPLGFNLSTMNGNIHLLVATTAFRNEP